MIPKPKLHSLQLNSRILIDKAYLLRVQQVNNQLMSTSLDDHWISTVESVTADAVKQVALYWRWSQLELNGAEGI